MRAVTVLPLAVLLLGVPGCTARFDRFAFEVENHAGAVTRRLAIRESPGRRREDEGILAVGAGERGTPLLRLARPVTVPAGLAFVLAYTSDVASCELTVLGDEGELLATAALPATAGAVWRMQAALPAASRVRAFRLATRAAAGRLELLGAGLETPVRGFAFGPDGLTLDGSVTVRSAGAGRLAARLASAARAELEGADWQIALDIGAPGGARLSLGGPSGSALLAVDASASRRIYLHEGGSGFLPRDLEVRLDGEATASPAVRSLSIGLLAEGAPIPADPGQVLDWDRSRWRRSDFEVFCWDRLPQVLIFDTASYEVQEQLFRRLAFFVEKPETAGTVPDPAAVEGRRSWNAHDYRAEDLGRFFTLAGTTADALLPHELLLKKILVANGLIVEEGSAYRAGFGAVLSISRSSSSALRELLLTHECFHGLFFSLPAFRDACIRGWQQLSADERVAWLAFLDLKGYNTADPYLMANEFQSYLFQQEREQVAAFQSVTLQRAMDRFPDRAAAIRRVLAARPDSFLISFDRLERELLAAGGPPGGRAIAVRRVR